MKHQTIAMPTAFRPAAFKPVALLWVAVVLFTFGCQSAPKALPTSTSGGNVDPQLFERKPIDIAILPVYMGRTYEPKLAKALRRRAKEELLELRFSPVAFESIDDKLGRFADNRVLDINQIRGNFDEDAILYVMLDEWDNTESGVAIADLSCRLYDSRTGEELWYHVQSDKAVETPAPYAIDGDLTTSEYIARNLIDEAMATLPSKDTVRAGNAGSHGAEGLSRQGN